MLRVIVVSVCILCVYVLLLYYNVFYYCVYYVGNWVSSPTCGCCEVEAFVGCLMLNLDTSWLMYLPDVANVAFEAY